MYPILLRCIIKRINVNFFIILGFYLILVSYICMGETYVCAHRGDVKNAPENTLPAFQSAVKKGVHMIEFDVRMTKDGHLVIMHDEKVDRTTNGKGKVQDLLSEEIYKLDAGKWFSDSFAGTKIPSLYEAITTIPYGILCNVHVYGDEFVTEVVAKTLKETGQMGRCFIACNNEKQVEILREKVPEMKICLLPEGLEKRRNFIERGIRLKVSYVQISITQGLDNLKEDIELAHQHGIKVNFFSAQDPETIKKLAEAGVDYILTDNVDLCFDVLKEYGTKPLDIKNQEKDTETPQVLSMLNIKRF